MSWRGVNNAQRRVNSRCALRVGVDKERRKQTQKERKKKRNTESRKKRAMERERDTERERERERLRRGVTGLEMKRVSFPLSSMGTTTRTLYT